MSDLTADPADEVPVVAAEAPQAEAPPAVESEQAAEAPPEDAGELVVTIGDEPAPKAEDENAAPAWLKDLRKSDREKTRRIRELEARLQQTQPAQSTIVVGAKPSLQSCEYDEEKFAAELDAWHDRKRQADDQQREAQRAQEAQAAEWQKRLRGYEQQKLSLRVPGIEVAEEAVKDALSVTQQSLMIKACKQPALMVAALGHNERELKRLAAITDPVEFVAELIRTEVQVKTNRKPATAPERSVPKSSMSGASAVDNELERLRAQAEKTGDRTPVVRYLQGKARQVA